MPIVPVVKRTSLVPSTLGRIMFFHARPVKSLALTHPSIDSITRCFEKVWTKMSAIKGSKIYRPKSQNPIISIMNNFLFPPDDQNRDPTQKCTASRSRHGSCRAYYLHRRHSFWTRFCLTVVANGAFFFNQTIVWKVCGCNSTRWVKSYMDNVSCIIQPSLHMPFAASCDWLYPSTPKGLVAIFIADQVEVLFPISWDDHLVDNFCQNQIVGTSKMATTINNPQNHHHPQKKMWKCHDHRTMEPFSGGNW